MAYNRPKLTEIHARILDDIDGRVLGADSRLRHSVLGVFARVLAGAFNAAYGLLDYWSKQIFVDSSDKANLARHAANWSVPRKAATKAVGTATITGADDAVVTAGSLLIDRNGGEYTTTALATIDGDNAIISIEAIEEGTSGNLSAGEALTFAAPVVGINASAVIIEMGGGNDEETDEPLKARLLSRIQRPPHGGNKSDYETWALEVPGVTRAWVSPGELGLGTVTTRFVLDDRDDIFPAQPDIDAVQAHIDAQGPVGAEKIALGPIPAPLNFIIRAAPPSADVKAAIRAELADLVRREAAPGGLLYISHIRESISLAAGEIDHELLAPGGNVQSGIGQLLIIGTIDFVG